VLRVAIVGLGPKGMFALERLLDHAARAGGDVVIDVDAFEPHPVAGAGPIYDPGQPPYLRMNFAAEQIDIWGRGSTLVPLAEQQSFVSWSRAAAQACEPGSYPARADVGRYLASGLATMLRHAPPYVDVSVHAARVRALCRASGSGSGSGSGWTVAGAAETRYDEVLIATGHERSWDGALSVGWDGPAAVFPVEVELSRARVPPGATVAARGFALTFIDAALALTEGRGGRFEARDHPYRLRYLPCGDEVGSILPFSRTGRPLLAKPPPLAASHAEIARRGRERVSGLEGTVDLRRDLLPVLAATASASLLAGAGAACEPARLRAWLAGAAAGRPLPHGRGPADELDRSLAVGAGLVAPDLPWALGHAWRALYPALVAQLGHGRLTPSDWAAFRRLAGEMERIAFGPSPINAAKLLALVDAGYVDLSHVAGGRLARDGRRMALRSASGGDPIDVVVDAVLPGPGWGGRGGLLGDLIADGHVHVPAGRRGLDVDADGSCRGRDGSVTTGLAAIGRPTEDSVIGNDTLNPRLHDVADRWAGRVVARARRGEAGPTTALAISRS
jgi:uncharacterized NAD(P)/FAD-binding protein YdhS